MRFHLIAALSVAASAAALPLAATANAQDLTVYDFQSPSGNIGCSISDFGDGTGAASCKLHHHTWESSPQEICPGDGQEWGSDVILNRGTSACVGVVPSQIWLGQEYGTLPTLGYGQSHTLGTITCASEPSGVRCTDTKSGQFFQVSRDAYRLG